MKRIVVMVLLIMVVTMSFAQANELTNAFVTCNKLSVRIAPDTNSSKYTSLTNGETMFVVGETSNNKGENFYVVRLSSLQKDISDFDENGNQRYGYVMKEFVKVSDKQYVVLSEDTILWAAPGSAIGVRERSAGEKLLLLDEYIDAYAQKWYVVQANESAGGSGFVFAGSSWIGQSQIINESANSAFALVDCSTLAVRNVPNDDSEPIGYLHNGDIVKVVQSGEYFTSIEYSYKGATVLGFVHTKYLVNIIQ